MVGMVYLHMGYDVRGRKLQKAAGAAGEGTSRRETWRAAGGLSISARSLKGLLKKASARGVFGFR
jgi:hypothetical protein